MSAARRPAPSVVSFGDLHLEFVEEGVSLHRDWLEALRQEVLEVAARSRGWDDPGEIERFGRVFKLESLYEADGLVLIRRQGRLVGLMGGLYDWRVCDAALVHVGSLGLERVAQNRGLLPVFFCRLWELASRRPEVAQRLSRGSVYVTAITQSPYILAWMLRFSDVYPSPARSAPDPEMVAVAQAVARRFDPDIPFDAGSFVLRGECKFFYRTLPYSLNRSVNAFCDARLRYGEGDVFVLVGRCLPEKVQSYVEVTARRYPELTRAVRLARPRDEITLGAAK